jgi:hypothetical protein
MTRKNWIRCSTALVALAVLAVSVGASALTRTGCTVSRLTYDQGRIIMQCVGDSNNYSVHTDGSPAACPKVSEAVADRWFSMFEAALLSGKQVTVEYTNAAAPCSTRVVSSVQLY